MKLAYFVQSFPAVSEAFVLQEVLAMRARASRVVIFAMERPVMPALHPEAQPLLADTRYVEEERPDRSAHAKAHARWASHAPGRYLRTLGYCRRSGPDMAWRFKHIPYYASALARLGIDHLHCHFASPAARDAMLISSLSGIPFSVTTYRYDIFDQPLTNLRDLALAAKAFVTVSRYNARYLAERFSIPADRIHVIATGIDVQRFTPHPIATAVPEVVSVARLHPVKGLAHLIEACQLLHARGRAFRCTIIGRGPLEDELRSMISARGLSEHVILAGAMAQDGILAHFHRARAFVLPSHSEGLNVSTMEAMACGLPCVVTDVCGMPELVDDGVTGFVVPPGQPAAIAERLDALLGDPDLAARLGREARRKAERELAIPQQLQRLIDLIRPGTPPALSPSANGGPHQDRRR